MDEVVRSLGTILGVWAHPDDETYLTAGIMAAARRLGQRVVCVTATQGEQGSQDAGRWPPERIAEIRGQELARALEILGVKEHHWLGYRDGSCALVPPDEAARTLATLIAEVQPDTVLTFGPEGQTGHPDHIAVSGWTMVAFAAAAGAEARLHYATATPDWMARLGPVLEPYSVFAPGNPHLTAKEELTIDLELPEDLLALKLDALAAQASQTESLRAALPPDVWLDLVRQEAFREAARG